MVDLFIDELKELLRDMYEIKEKIGKGGSGRVYRAVDNEGKEVALKIIKSECSDSESSIRRIERELKTAEKIDHKNVVKIRKLDSISGVWFIEMELIDGENLYELIKREELREDQKLSIAKDIIEGLESIHSEGIIHRDIKPSNIVVNRDGRAVITDFGLAKSKDMTNLSRTALYSGTPQYTAPEIWKGGGYSEQTDIYSLGILLYELFYGKLPFESDSDYGYMSKHLYEPVSFPTNSTPEHIKHIIEKSLKKKKSERYKSLKSIKSDNTKKRTRDTFIRKIRNRYLLSILIGILMLIGIYLLIGKKSGDQFKDEYRFRVYFTDEASSPIIKAKGKILYRQLKQLLRQPQRIYNAKSGLECELNFIFNRKAREYDYVFHILQTQWNTDLAIFECIVITENENEVYRLKIESVEYNQDLMETADALRDSVVRVLRKLIFKLDKLEPVRGAGKSVKDKLKTLVNSYDLYGDRSFCSKKRWYKPLIDENRDLVRIINSVEQVSSNLNQVDTGTMEFNGEIDYSKPSSNFRAMMGLQGWSAGSFNITNHLEEIQKIYSEFSEQNPIIFDILSSRLIAYGRWHGNIKLYKNKWDSRKNYDAVARLVYTYFRLGFLHEASSLLMEYAGKKPYKLYLRQLWQYYILKRDFRKALEISNRILYDENGSAESRRIRGLTYLWKGELSKAEKEFATLYSRTDDDSYKMFLLNNYYLDLYRGKLSKVGGKLSSALKLSVETNSETGKTEALIHLVRKDIVSGKFKGFPKEYIDYINKNDEVISSDVSFKLKGIVILGYLRANNIHMALSLFYKNMNQFNLEHSALCEVLQRFLYEEIRLHTEKIGLSRAFEELYESYHAEADIWGENHHALFLNSLAKAYRNENRRTSELATYRKIQQLTFGALYYGDIYAKSFYHCGRILYKRKKWKRAAADFKKFLKLWGDGDRDVFPEIEKAEKMLKKITNR